ncbi:MAG TPA: hypothetical protein VG714_08345 [Acidobacteriaceae bacterium]|nr:hypothetical protein [Acidobacteriaceae bacterium]
MAVMRSSLRPSLVSAPVCSGLLASLLAFALFAGCGASSPTSTSLSVAPTFTTGDYIFTFNAGTSTAFQVPGALTIGTANAVSGALVYNNPQNSACGQQTIFVSGNINNNTSILKLTSAAFANSTATVTLQLPLAANTSGATVGAGTAVITGGSCALDSGAVQAQFIPNFSGTWSGTLGSTSVSVLLTEQAANPAGQFPITASGSGLCNLSQPFTATGLVTGANAQIFASGISIATSLGSAPNSLNVSITCDTGDPLTGILTH